MNALARAKAQLVNPVDVDGIALSTDGGLLSTKVKRAGRWQLRVAPSGAPEHCRLVADEVDGFAFAGPRLIYSILDAARGWSIYAHDPTTDRGQLLASLPERPLLSADRGPFATWWVGDTQHVAEVSPVDGLRPVPAPPPGQWYFDVRGAGGSNRAVALVSDDAGARRVVHWRGGDPAALPAGPLVDGAVHFAADDGFYTTFGAPACLGSSSVPVLSTMGEDTVAAASVDVDSATATVLHRHPTVDVTGIDHLGHAYAHTLLGFQPVTHDGLAAPAPIAVARGRGLAAETVVEHVASTDRDDFSLVRSGRRSRLPITNASNPLVRTEILEVDGSDGVRVDIRVTAPERPDGRAVIVLGGGFADASTGGFDGESQWLAAAGVVAVRVNHRGTIGRGRRFHASADGRWHSAAAGDVARVAAWLAETGRANAAQVTLAGWSIGFGIAAWASIMTPGSRCIGVLGVLDYDKVVADVSAHKRHFSIRLPAQLGMSEQRPHGAAPPMDAAELMTAPTLLVNGERDRKAPPHLASRFADTLHRRGVRCQTVVLPGEEHSVRKPENRAVLYERLLAFVTEDLRRDMSR